MEVRNWFPERTSGVVPNYGYGHSSMNRLLNYREIGSTYINSGLSNEIHGHGSLLQRMSCTCVLDGHTGCVNTLSWNEKGSLLASGSDDLKIVLWDYKTKRALTTITTVHHRNIFSVAFIGSDNILASGAMDASVQIHTGPEFIHPKIFRYHKGRVKDVRSSPELPSLFWSAAEDGIVFQYDLRDLPPSFEDVPRMPLTGGDTHSSSGPLISLGRGRNNGPRIGAMGISIHPLDTYQMALACGDQYIRVFDRRMLRRDTRNRTIPTRLFAPGHIQANKIDQVHQKGTSVAYNCDGSEILVSYHGDHMYLFNNAKMDGNGENAHPKMTYNYGYRARHTTLHPVADMTNLRTVGNAAFASTEYSTAISVYTKGIEIGLYFQKIYVQHNEDKDIVSNYKNELSKLYCNRSVALLRRKWRGDVYASLEDATYAIDLQPEYRKAHYRRIQSTLAFGQRKEAVALARAYIRQFPDHAHELNDLSVLVPPDMQTHNVENVDDESDESDEMMPTLVSDSESDEQSEISDDENEEDSYCLQLISTDVIRRYIGYCNIQTDIKEARFFGPNDTHIISGSDDGRALIWEKSSGKLVNALDADADIVNCVQPHPYDPVFVTSGIENVIRVWSPSANSKSTPNGKQLEAIINGNQEKLRQPLGQTIDDGMMRVLMDRYAETGGAPECTQS